MIVYTSKVCGPCRTLKHLLTKWNTPYEERDINVPKYAEEASKLGLQVPIVVEGDDVVVGFNIDRIKQLLV